MTPTTYIRTYGPILFVPTHSPIFAGTTAATYLNGFAVDDGATVEEFGFVVSDAFAGSGGKLTFDLKNGSTVVATLTITLALGAAGTVIKTGTITAPADLSDKSTLSIARQATGTAFTAGSGHFYVRFRQLLQTAAA
jgi:hypothetical protein